jgi:hypothetical protein
MVVARSDPGFLIGKVGTYMRAIFVFTTAVVLCVANTTPQAFAASATDTAPSAAEIQPVEKLTATCIKVKGRAQPVQVW